MKHALLLNCFFKTSISILSNHACIVRFNYSRVFFKEIIVRLKYVILFSLTDKNKLQKHGFKKFKPVFCFLIKEECKIVDKRYFLTGFTREQDWFEKLVIMNKCGVFFICYVLGTCKTYSDNKPPFPHIFTCCKYSVSRVAAPISDNNFMTRIC